ncbi:MAG: metallophosphoesterase [Nitrospirae bacterium]|nr:metallophosphoesterase [Nitrospirota bacterium]
MNVFSRMRRALAALGAALALAAVPLLPGCGGGATGLGEVVIGLTDADGDFLAYQVDVTSLTLSRADGTQVQVLPLSTRVDFAQYTEMTEFLTAAMVPDGVYTGAEMVLDYTSADVQVEVAGAATPATLVDADGNPLAQVTMAVQLEEMDHILIRPGVPAHVVFDFDLAATNAVDLTIPAAPVVTVDPVLLAEVDADFAKPHRLRGLLDRVDLDNSEFTLHVRPFGHHGAAHRFGDFPVAVDGQTAFEIDGVAYTGADGLAALAALEPGSPVVAFGQVQRALRHMLASTVRAGSSVPWGQRDVAHGVLTSRLGDQLTLRGAVLSFDSGVGRPDLLRDTLTVLIGPDTIVTGPLGAPMTPADLSVGGRVTVVGDLLETAAVIAADLSVTPTLDATQGKARIEVSHAHGLVVATTAGTLTLDLRALNGRPVDIYDFAGTGATPADDSDPAAYRVDTGALDLSALAAGDPVGVRGLTAPFGAAPPDFLAMSLAQPPVEPEPRANLTIQWHPADLTPFTVSAPGGLVPDLSASPHRHHVVVAGAVIDLAGLGADARVVPAAEGGRYALQAGGALRVFGDFATFQAALDAALANGAAGRHLTAHGAWDGPTATFTADVVVVNLRRAAGGPDPVRMPPGLAKRLFGM